MVPSSTAGVFVMRDSVPQLVTVGVIASELGVSVDRVTRLLRTRPHIRPQAYAGNVRLFDNSSIAQVRYELTLIDARRVGKGGRHG
jgi:hypothetical protein